MTKLEKAVEIVRGWSDEELKEFLRNYCPSMLGLHEDDCDEADKCDGSCWNEEVSL